MTEWSSVSHGVQKGLNLNNVGVRTAYTLHHRNILIFLHLSSFPNSDGLTFSSEISTKSFQHLQFLGHINPVQGLTCTTDTKRRDISDGFNSRNEKSIMVSIS